MLIGSFCLSTSICSFHRCYLCLPRLHENHLFVRPKTSWARQLDRRQPHNYFTHREEIVCMLPHKQRFLLIPSACLWRSLFRRFISSSYHGLRVFSFINWQRFGPQESSRNSYEDWVRKQEIVPSKVIRIPESKKVLLVVSGIPGLGIRNPAKV